RGSEQPRGEAIVAGLDERGAERAEATESESVSGRGIRATVNGREVMIGSGAMMGEAGIDISALEAEAGEQRRSGATAMFAAIDGKPAALLAVTDPIKPTTAAALDRLRELGMTIVMLTGDNRATAEAIGAQLGIDRIEAEVLPDQKAEVIQRLQAEGEGHRVAMAGDGVNDAPALARADVGIAMGTGAGVAIESAGITLLGGDLSGLRRAIDLSRLTRRNILQNLWFAFGYNALGIPLAAGALYPVFGLVLSPML